MSEYTKQQKAFMEAFRSACKPGQHLAANNLEDEGFSRSPCDCCGSTLGGTRFFRGLAILQGCEVVTELDVCIDCMMFHCNGDLPDEWEK